MNRNGVLLLSYLFTLRHCIYRAAAFIRLFSFLVESLALHSTGELEKDTAKGQHKPKKEVRETYKENSTQKRRNFYYQPILVYIFFIQFFFYLNGSVGKNVFVCM